HACVACHAKRVAEFETTRHFRACCAPPPGSMPAGFAPVKGAFATRDPSLRFEMSQSGSEYLQTAIRSSPSGEERTPARIGLVYGSGGVADEMFFTWHDDRMYELPMAWLHPLNRWGVVTINPHGKGDFGRETLPRCLECHNTWIEHVP